MKEFPVLDTTAIGARIRELRKINKLTVEQIREFLGLESTQAIYKWQRGESMPTIDNLYALSILFETSVDSILKGSREEDERSSSFDFRDRLDFLIGALLLFFISM
jgi:transcriptional regulator with XRE-family HTH domain